MLTAHYMSYDGSNLKPINIRRLKFPAGEQHLAIDLEADYIVLGSAPHIRIDAHLDSSDEIMALLLLTDAIRRHIIGAVIHLRMPYVPYGRQDRPANPGEPLSLRVFGNLINSQRYASVHIVDPHSDVSHALLDNIVVEPPMTAVTKVIQRIAPAALVCPDAGARKRLSTISKRFCLLPVIFADKIRDTRTGTITGTQISAPSAPITASDKAPLLIIDDICDGGRTFIEIAKALRADGCPHPLHLYVTHGIFSQGIAPLLEHFAGLHTTNDWTRSQHPAVFTY